MIGRAKIALDPRVKLAAARGAWVVFNLSGGKDSTAAAKAASEWLDRIGHPRARRIAIHADLGLIEWRSTPETLARVCKAIGVKLVTVSRIAGGLIERWEQRFECGKARYAALETYTLIGPWSSAKLRFCTSELKTHIIERWLRQRFGGARLVSIVGLRRDESSARAKTPVAKEGAAGLVWHPLVEWSAEDVFALHRRHELPLHEAYRIWGASRMGCSFCVLSCERNLKASARARDNLPAYLRLVALEARSTFSFQSTRWLGEIAPELLPATLRDRLQAGMHAAALRRAFEASMPVDLRYTKGWPPRVPTIAEAEIIAGVRARILAHHQLTSPYRTGTEVRDRFAELHEAKRVAPEGRVLELVR